MITVKINKFVEDLQAKSAAELNDELVAAKKEKQKELYGHLNTIQRNLAHLPAEKIFINYKKSSKKK